MDNTIVADNNEISDGHVPSMTAFSIMFITGGLSCFVWQAMTAAHMFYQARKPILALVLFQALLGVAVTVVTLLASIMTIDCTFLLLFSVIGVNIADICLQFVLLWKAFLGNNRSKIILGVGCIPLVLIGGFIIANMTFGRSTSQPGDGLCKFNYPTYIVIVKAAIDCTSNTFLSGCFVLVIRRHYRVLGSSIQKTLITEGLIYCFGVCLSNILTGILLAQNVFGGSTPILYTVDWYLASYLIIKQLSSRHNNTASEEKEEDDDDDNNSSIISKFHRPSYQLGEEEHVPSKDISVFHNKERTAYYRSADSTLYASPSTITATRRSFDDVDEEKLYPIPTSPHFEKKVTDYSRKKSSTKLFQDDNTVVESLAVQEDDISAPEFPRPAIAKINKKK